MSTKKTREHKYVKPHYINLVIAKFKTDKEVGDLIGVSSSCIGTVRRNGEVTQVMENAAHGVWLQKFAPKNVNDNPVMILALDPAHHATIRSLVNNLGGSVMDVEQKIAAHKGRLAV